MKRISILMLVIVALVSVGCASNCPAPATASSAPACDPCTGNTFPWDNDWAAMKKGWIWQQGGKDWWKKPCEDPCCPDGSCSIGD